MSLPTSVVGVRPDQAVGTLALALQLLGGPEAPLVAAAGALNWPCRSRAALHYRRVRHTLPVEPVKRGQRYYVRAADLAATLMPTHEGVGANIDLDVSPSSRRDVDGSRRPGRPRKQAPTTTHGEVADHV